MEVTINWFFTASVYLINVPHCLSSKKNYFENSSRNVTSFGKVPLIILNHFNAIPRKQFFMTIILSHCRISYTRDTYSFHLKMSLKVLHIFHCIIVILLSLPRMALCQCRLCYRFWN